MESNQPDTNQVFLLGIGGAGQHALAEMLLDMGCRVSGSDLKLGDTALSLAQRGVKLYEGHAARNIEGATLVVTTAAAHPDNPELVEAIRRGIKVLSNAQMVAELVNQKRCLAVAGTHGKTTITNLVAGLLSKAGLDPSYYIGGSSLDLGHAGHAGQGTFSVVEADEYARRFLEYTPEAVLVTNIEADHLDYYGDFASLRAAFKQFAGKARKIFGCADDPEARRLAEEFKAERGGGVYLYGLDGLADWRAVDVQPNSLGGHDFTLWQANGMLGRVSLALPGLHNVTNVVGALGLCITLAPEVSPITFCKLVTEFKGTARRFEVKGEVNGVTVVDDYAHHPSEIKATLAAARARYKGRRLVAVFQPHTYSRTKALLDDFAKAFAGADVVALLEIFPARETDTLGVSSGDILGRMQHPGKQAEVLTLTNAAEALRKILQPGDVLLTLGAGDVWKIGQELLNNGSNGRN